MRGFHASLSVNLPCLMQSATHWPQACVACLSSLSCDYPHHHGHAPVHPANVLSSHSLLGVVWHRAEVAKPTLALSDHRIAFAYTWEQGLEPAQMVQPLEVRNVSALPLEVRLRASPPFCVSQAFVSLEADAGAIISVTCDAAMGCGPEM